MSKSVKRAHALNGDLVSIEHPELDLSSPFTSHLDVVFDGVTHQLLSTADISGFNFANTTGEFTVGDLGGYIIESLDNVATQASHVYRAVVISESGALTTQSYHSVNEVLRLVGAVRPLPTVLGIVIDPDDTVEITSAPKVAMSVAIGVIEATPLTSEVIDGLPLWAGSTVPAGELYGGRFTDEVPYLILVTPTARVISMLGESADADTVAESLARLGVHWAT